MARESVEKVIGPLLNALTIMPFQRLPRMSNTRVSRVSQISIGVIYILVHRVQSSSPRRRVLRYRSQLLI